MSPSISPKRNEPGMATLPRHVAIIMDGNGRWAKKRGYPRVYGHIRGAKRVREIIREANDLGVEALTLYAFSTENWARPQDEVGTLWKILAKFLTRELNELNRQNAVLNVIGDISQLHPEAKKVLERSIQTLRNNTGLRLTLALSYGAQQEILSAARVFAQDCLDQKIDPKGLDAETWERYLSTSFLGDLSKVDLLIRTSGEKRLSNFLLWQCAYAEFLFVDELWPDFDRKSLREALGEFTRRDRRFGAISTNPPERSLS